MDRQKLDRLYLSSQGAPARVIARALSETPLEAGTYQFLADHVDELDVDALIALFNTRVADDVERAEQPFVRRLARIVPSLGSSAKLLAVLELSDKVGADAWIEDLVLPLRGQLPTWLWYRFVDKARGGELFNALNVGMPTLFPSLLGFPYGSFFPSFEERRPEPIVVGLLDRAHDDLAVAKYALETQPVPTLLRLHERFPKLITLDKIKAVGPKRASSTTESWVLSNDPPPLPPRMVPFIVERLHHCDEFEARVLYAALSSLPPGTHTADLYDLAVARFKCAVSGPPANFSYASWWMPFISAGLRTGAAWKTKGMAFVELCMDLGKGFPMDVLRDALDAAEETEGATDEEHRRSILHKVHDVTANLLVERAEQALNTGDYNAADLFLSAFTSLDPGSFISGALHRLRKISDLPPAIIARITACEELAGARGREPTEDGLNEAFLVLTGRMQ